MMTTQIKGAAPIADPQSMNDKAVSLPAPQGMKGQDIICFAKEWNEDPTSCNHVLRELAKNNRVLWLNSISTRAPNLVSGRDLRKIARRILGNEGATPVGD